ncbi:MAG: hypothetical protein GX436_05070 [Synergistaceae bacterium]|nr:hypothetical protein [Synergistaceae bacterium]
MVDVQGFHPDCGGFVSGHANEAEGEDLRRFCDSPTSKSALMRAINAMKLSPETKSFLKSLCETTVKVGKTVLFVGRKLVEVLIEGIRRFPNTAAGIVIGGVLGALAMQIPLIGWLLGWLMPVLMFIGGGLGFLEDLKDQRARRELRALSETLKARFESDGR